MEISVANTNAYNKVHLIAGMDIELTLEGLKELLKLKKEIAIKMISAEESKFKEYMKVLEYTDENIKKYIGIL